jgi:soluble lytic murein transglycosylase-like protein
MKLRIEGLIIVFVLFCGVAAAGTQTERANLKSGANGGQTGSAHDEVDKTGKTDSVHQPSTDLAKAAEQYKAALNNLASLYEADLKKVTDRNANMKELFDRGIIARVELEKSQNAVTEAQAKLDGVRKQIASAEADQNTASSWSPASELVLQWSTGNLALDGMIRHYSSMYGVDPFLVYCVARQESGFTASAISPKGASGLMQLMPDTGARYGVTNLFDPEQNIRAGVHYLKDLLQRFHGNIDLALAGYNAGEGAVIRSGNTIPHISETEYYVHTIGKRYGARPSSDTNAPPKNAASRKKKSKGAAPAPIATAPVSSANSTAVPAPAGPKQ